MAKKDAIAKGIGELNIDTLASTLDKTQEKKVQVDNVKYVENIVRIGDIALILRKEDTEKGKWFLHDRTEINEHLTTLIKNQNAKNYVVETRKAKKIQTGIYFENNVNAIMTKYLNDINIYLKEEFGTKLTRAEFIDNVIYDFLVTNKLFKKSYETNAKNRKKLDNLGEDMLQISHEGLPLKSLLFKKRTNKALYLTLDNFESINNCYEFIFSDEIGGRSLFVNHIFRNWLIENTNATPKKFSRDFMEILSTQFKKTDFESYFNMKNRITNDTHKFNKK